MAKKITTDIVDEVKDALYATATEYAKTRRHLRYADIRLEVGEGRGAVAENGNEKFSAEDYGISFGVRVLAGDKVDAPGYYGQILGSADWKNLVDIVRAGLRHAHRRALANAERKAQARDAHGPLGQSLRSISLAPIEVHQDVVPFQFQIDPRSVPLGDISQYAREVSQAVAALDPLVRFNFVSMATSLGRELFCSSEGASIDQGFALTQGMAYVVTAGDKGSQELYDVVGHQRGWEVLSRGVDDGYIRNPDFMAFALELTRDAVELCDAPPLKATEQEVVVVTDPHYNTLLVHEIIGHPTELDRALKMETAYAGRTWLLRNLTENQVGKQIASPLVTAFSDPSLPGYGHYKYDHEGTPAKKVIHIDKGIFAGFMNSRQTASIMGTEPNGSYKATDASLVPLIRMSNTVFANGDRDPKDIIGEVEHGYYLVGHRIPSIAESRENFRISARKVYEIRNGQMGQLFRDGGIMADSKDYLMSVDAVGNDFRLYPIPNCGKGQPMQTKKLGNGGPTMRSHARLNGV